MEGNKPTIVMCTVLAIDNSNLFYRACSLCEGTLPDAPNSLCRFCNSFNSSSSSSSKRLFHLLNGNAQHLRAISVSPLRTGFQAAIETLRELYGVRASS
ncbi:hypothetical protein P3X46_000156 [Hevea brasiliensis]|uniref:Replication factor A C-terminal domain-containing protein n=1 Tax=Hevea brasiliensis TaxID=3981 RepID=A0ABQ9N8P4_HEVBR|nr:hypothetical protein P3X46_000156 [Hevea brasiliensis]